MIPEDVNYQVGLLEAAMFLGLDSLELQELVESGQFAALNTPRVLRDMLFDVRTLDDINQRLYARSLPANDTDDAELIELQGIFGKLKYSGMNKAKLITTLLSEPRIALYSDVQTGDWKVLRIHEPALLFLLEDAFASQLPQTMSSAAFRAMCGLSASQLQTLIMQTNLHYAGWHETDRIPSSVAQQFFEHFLLLNRAAKLYGFELRDAHHRLSNAGVATAFEPDSKRPVLIYQKCDMVGHALTDNSRVEA